MKYLGLIVAVVMMFVSGVAFAGNMDSKVIGHTITGDNEIDCPVLNEIGIAHVWNKGAKAEVRTQISYTSNIRSLTDDNSIKIQNIVEF